MNRPNRCRRLVSGTSTTVKRLTAGGAAGSRCSPQYVERFRFAGVELQTSQAHRFGTASDDVMTAVCRRQRVDSRCRFACYFVTMDGPKLLTNEIKSNVYRVFNSIGPNTESIENVCPSQRLYTMKARPWYHILVLHYSYLLPLNVIKLWT